MINAQIIQIIKIISGGFPGGSGVKNLSANAGDMGLILDLGQSHMLQSNQAGVPQLLNPCSRACRLQPLGPWLTLLKPMCLESLLHNKRSRCNEKPKHHNRESPLPCHN